MATSRIKRKFKKGDVVISSSQHTGVIVKLYPFVKSNDYVYGNDYLYGVKIDSASGKDGPVLNYFETDLSLLHHSMPRNTNNMAGGKKLYYVFESKMFGDEYVSTHDRKKDAEEAIRFMDRNYPGKKYVIKIKK